MRPEFGDPAVQGVLRKIELAHPSVRRKIRWARLLDVYWIDLPASREDMIPAIVEIFWDRVLQWIFTGNLIPSAAGKTGGLVDLMQSAPNRPGKFWALERRFRPGVTDNVARTVIEAFEIVLGGAAAKKTLAGGRAASGSLLLMEGPELSEDDLSQIARDVFCNELIESWTVLSQSEVEKSERFHQERVKRDLPRVTMRPSEQVERIALGSCSESELAAMSRKHLWALSVEEMKAIQAHYANPDVVARRRAIGLDDPTDVEMEVIAQTWSEHCKHKIFGAKFKYKTAEPGGPKIPPEIDGLFKTTIVATTEELRQPWLLSVFDDNAGIVAFDEEDAFCIKVETHNSPSALDPYGGALTGIVGVNRDILGCGLGAKPIFNTDVFCVAPLDYAEPIPERLLHPRRILAGVRQGVEHGGNKSGIPTINGALAFDERYLGKPLVYCGTGGFMPRKILGRPCELKEVKVGDRIVMVGGRIGKDGIHGATFSSLALDEASPVSAVQLGDPITQKRAGDFLLEARDQGLYRAITDNGAGGLSSSVGEMARLSGGARMDVSGAKVKYPGLRPYELVVSESQERMTVAVPPEHFSRFRELAEKRGVEISDLGEFTDTGRFDIFHAEKLVGSLSLEFLHHGVPRLTLQADWAGRPKTAGEAHEISFGAEGAHQLLELMGRPNIASKEWLIRQYDHEVQGASVVKPLHTFSPGTAAACSGPNDAGVLKPKAGSDLGLAVGCGLNPKLSDIDPYLMAQSAVDEAVRNVLCVGAEFGKPESVIALVDNFCWPDPVVDRAKAGALVRACYGMRDAALALRAPFVSGKDSMKNDFRGRLQGKEVTISVPPTLLVTAVARVADVKLARTADFKAADDVIYLLGGDRLGLRGSELEKTLAKLPGRSRVAEPDWDQARKIYSWLGRAKGKEQPKLRSVHDISDGGLLVAIAEGLLARGFGAFVELPHAEGGPWEGAFGEGFHSFVCSATEADGPALEAEWATCGVTFRKLGKVNTSEKLEVAFQAAGVGGASTERWSVPIKDLREAWLKKGFWE